MKGSNFKRFKETALKLIMCDCRNRTETDFSEDDEAPKSGDEVIKVFIKYIPNGNFRIRASLS